MNQSRATNVREKIPKPRLWIWILLLAVLLGINFKIAPFYSFWNPRLGTPYDISLVIWFFSFLLFFHLLLCPFRNIPKGLLKVVDYAYYTIAAIGVLLGAVEARTQIEEGHRELIRDEINVVQSNLEEEINLLKTTNIYGLNNCSSIGEANRDTSILKKIGIDGSELGREYCDWLENVKTFLNSDVTYERLKNFIRESRDQWSEETDLGKTLRNLRVMGKLSFVAPELVLRMITIDTIAKLFDKHKKLKKLKERLVGKSEGFMITSMLSLSLGFFYAPIILATALALRITKVSAEIFCPDKTVS